MLNPIQARKVTSGRRWGRRLPAAVACAVAASASVSAETAGAGEEAASSPVLSADPTEALGALPAATARTAPSFYFENDGTFLRPNDHTDRHYTSGQGASVAWRGAGRGIADGLGLPAENRTALGLVVAQQMFTPDNVDEPPRPGDRPYGGYLYLGGFWQREHREVFDHVQLDLGVVGPSSLAEQTQEAVHAFSYADDPDWSRQLRDEVQVNLTLRRKWRLDLGETTLAGRPIGWQLIPRAELDVGTTYRRVGAGALVRAGYRLPDDFGPGRLVDLASETSDGYAERKSGLSTYVFGQAVARYVEWNTFLDGSYGRNPSPAVSKEPWVGEFSGGFAVEWKRHRMHARLAYMQTYSTPTFELQGRGNTVGSLALRVILSY